MADLPANKEEFYTQVEKAIEEKKALKGITKGQKEYLDTINASVITLCSGPAGSGKTYMAVVRSLELLKEQKFKKLVIVRPIVECEEELGYLPGKVEEKIDPYMRPIKDILNDQLDPKTCAEMLGWGIIELTALAYMRGRSLNNSIMILDEAQNATYGQIKMFMTRIGQNSKIIICGDETQSDNHKHAGAYVKVIQQWSRPEYVDGINVSILRKEDIVRNDLIAKILEKMKD